VLRRAISEWYAKWYNVALDPDHEILPLIGSKEGIMHICMAYLNDGDEVLVPNPGYPTYSSAVRLAGGKCVEYTLSDEGGYYPQPDALSALDLSKVKLMFLNYPHMPTGQVPASGVFEQLVDFARAHGILLVHDNPYSMILTRKPMSLLSVEGARDCAIELNSLSKSHNMAGWRVGMLCGARERIDDVLRFKSNMDSGMFLPVQLAAAKALSLGEDWYVSVNNIYRDRREKVYELLSKLKCTFSTTQAGLFVWAKIPAVWKNAFAFSDDVLYQANVFITPGGIFGSAGNDHVRVSLCAKAEVIEEASNRISKTQF
jgi:aspartate/methionine/tyrosine aminotransferase